MAGAVLIDSGPLVAALRRRDRHHGWARAQFESRAEPFVTCEAVISADSDFRTYRKNGRQMIPLIMPE